VVFKLFASGTPNFAVHNVLIPVFKLQTVKFTTEKKLKFDENNNTLFYNQRLLATIRTVII